MIHSCERSTRWICLPQHVQRQISILDMRRFGSTEHAWQLSTSFASSKKSSQTWPLARSLESFSMRYSVYWSKLINREHFDWRTLITGECKWLSSACLFVFKHSLFSLSQEHNLRAVRYLPDILALLRILSDRFHRRIDREKANQLKIRELLQEFSKKGSTVHPYLSKVFASGLYSETWCQNVVMKSFSLSCMFSLQLRDQFLF